MRLFTYSTRRRRKTIRLLQRRQLWMEGCRTAGRWEENGFYEARLLCQPFAFAPFFLRFTPVRRGITFGSPVAAFLTSPPSSSAISAKERRLKIETGAISVTSSVVV